MRSPLFNRNSLTNPFESLLILLSSSPKVCRRPEDTSTIASRDESRRAIFFGMLPIFNDSGPLSNCYPNLDDVFLLPNRIDSIQHDRCICLKKLG